MPSRAVYTALAFSRSDTGCSTVLIPWVEEAVMIAPEVVGHIDPVGLSGLKTNGKPANRLAGLLVGHASCGSVTGASRFLIGLVIAFAMLSRGDPADVELGEQLGIVEHVDRHRAVADDRERQHRERPLAVERDRAGGAVDECRASVRREATGAHRTFGDLRGAAQLLRVAVAAVGAEHD